MKGQTADKRNTDAKTLLNYGFSTYALADIAPQEPLAPVPVRLGAEDAVQPVLPSGSTLLVEKTKAGQLTQSVELPGGGGGARRRRAGARHAHRPRGGRGAA